MSKRRTSLSHQVQIDQRFGNLIGIVLLVLGRRIKGGINEINKQMAKKKKKRVEKVLNGLMLKRKMI